jgi:CheY-like chemotaxis protein
MAYVMLVDDDEDFANAAAKVLRLAGHEVQVDLDTKSALERARQRRPDLVILDVIFPEDSSAGFRLARAMRHFQEGLQDVPILLLTAINIVFPLGFSARDIDARWLPVSAFLEKPIDFDVLRKTVEQILAEGPSQPPGT